MKLRKTIKQIVALGTGATMLGATLFGATAANLADYPSPFVKDGKANTWIVVGDNAAAADVIGAVDIATSLQAAAVSETVVNIPGTGTVATISNGYKIGTAGAPLVLNGDLQAGRDRLRDLHLDLLSDGTASIDNTNYDYTQVLNMGDAQVQFAAVQDVPQIFINLRDATNRVLWNYELSIDRVDVTGLGSSESIEMMGKSFTFDPNLAAGDDLKLYASDVTRLLDLNVPVTIESEGRTHTLEVVGGNSDQQNVILLINGQQRTVVEGQTYTIGGLDVFVEDIFITNIPVLSASATVFVGSLEVEIPQATGRIKINGKTVSGLEGRAVVGAGLNQLDGIELSFAPFNLRNDVPGHDRVERLFPGGSITDPLLGTFSVDFDGMTYGLMDPAKAKVIAEAISDEISLTYESYYGNTITFVPYVISGGAVAYGFATGNEGFGLFNHLADIPEMAIFALEEDVGTERGTKLYEVERIVTGDSVELRDLGSDQTRVYKEGDQIAETQVTVTFVGAAADRFRLDMSAIAPVATSDRIYLKGGKSYLDLDTDNIKIEEHNGDTLQLNIEVDGTDLEIDSVGAAGISNAYHRDRKEQMYLTDLGTYGIYDSDNKDVFEAWVVTDEDNKVKFNVFVKPEGATIASGGTTGGTVVTQTVNPIAVGTGKLASEVRNVGAQNMVVVGGPCANTVAAQLMGNPADCAEGFEEGKAIIKLFESGNNVAMLVAGYSATDTRRAARVVADYSQYSEYLSGTEVEVSGTSTTFMDTTVTVPTSN